MHAGSAAFDKAYGELNKDQKRAVDTVHGPVLVVAGPGTGKTQLLSMRVAQIIKTTDTDPSQILCLTFTNKAAANMRERLFLIAGADTRHVVVKTFHAFATEIMQRYPDYFWNAAGLATAPDAVQLEIIEEILSVLPLDNPLALKFAGQYTLIADVKKGLKLIKEAGLTPDKLRAIINYNLAYVDEVEPLLIEALKPRLGVKQLPILRAAIRALKEHEIEASLTPLKSLREVLVTSLEHAITLDLPTNKTTNSGAWKKRWIQTVDGTSGMHDERKRNRWWLLLADVYDSYRKKLHQRGFYDYADMLVEVISQLERHADLRADVQEQFLYVLIDEFQDTNAAQLRLAHLVADHHLSEGAPNIMAVGDDDQTIYKFNGAELNNMLGFTASYPSVKLFVLEENYRSNQQVLEAAERVIKLTKDRLVHRVKSLSKQLVSKSNPPVKKGEQQLHIYMTQQHELSAVADRLSKLSPGERANTAVLARGHESLGRLAYLCHQKGIAIRYEQDKNVLEHEAVRQFTNLAEIIVELVAGNKNGVNSLLQQALRHPMWELSPKQLWRLATANHPNGDWIATMSASQDKSIAAISNWILAISSDTASQPLPLSMEYLLGLRAFAGYTSPIKKHFTAQSHGTSYLETLSAIRLLRGLVQEFAKGQHKTLSDFVALVRIMRANDQIISDESPFVSGDHGVQLLTIHKAKGLEFDRVYIIDCTESIWRPRPARRRPPANLPLQPNGDDEDDFVRLMYVAITRARHSVYLYSYAQDEAGNDQVTSPLALIATPADIHRKEPVAGQDIAVAVLEEHLAWPRLEAADEKPMLKERLDDFALNVTGLLNFLDVSRGGPQYFLERNLLRLPEAKTASLGFGTAIHAALETALQLTNKDNFSLSKVLKSFAIALTNENLPAHDHARQLQHGQTLLKHLLARGSYELPKGSLAEVDLQVIMANGVVVSGSLDRVDAPSNDSLVIVDYKTGSALTNLVTENKSYAIKAWKHRSQLIFYALLAKNSPKFTHYKHITGQMVYLEADSPRHLIKSFVPTDEDIKQMAQLSSLVWQKIKVLDLPDTSGYPQDFNGVKQFESDLINGRV